jgi:hypothetical protein
VAELLEKSDFASRRNVSPRTTGSPVAIAVNGSEASAPLAYFSMGRSLKSPPGAHDQT